jgi:hypothetical protein
MNIQDLPEEDPNGAFKQPRRLPTKVVVPITKTVTYQAPHGELHIELEDDTYYVWYHNSHFKGSPFKCSVSFSTAFTIEQIRNSYEVSRFLSRFK